MGNIPIDWYSVVLVCSAFTLNALSCGLSYTFGLYYITFLEVFQEGSTITSWIGSINFAVECGTGKVMQNLRVGEISEWNTQAR